MNIRQRIANIISPQAVKNSGNMGLELYETFWRNGNTRYPAIPDWSLVLMDEKDKYNGFMYGAVQRRVNAVARLAAYNLMTDAKPEVAQAAKKKKEQIIHPYLTLIDKSPEFANDQFWREIQTFLDIKGDYYLMAVRGKAGEKFGPIKEFKLIRPYEITVLWDLHEVKVVGYVQTHSGASREIPPHMIIPIRMFNPFTYREPYSTADAAASSQYTLKELAEQVRKAAQRNRKYPGVVSLGGNGVALDAEQVRNFKERIRGKSGTDEPMFVNSGGANGMNWLDMQIDVRKSAIDKLTETQLEELVAVTGTSKTKLGIEQSGVTRDSAAIQDDLFITDQAMPALQLIIDALNQDYKVHYADEYEKTGYKMWIDSPLPEDKDAKIADTTNRTNMLDLYTSMINQGYDPDVASGYVKGERDLDEIGLPTNPPKKDPKDDTPPAEDPTMTQPIQLAALPSGQEHDHLALRLNKFDNTSQGTIQQRQGALQNTIVGIESQMVSQAVAQLSQADYKYGNDPLDAAKRQRLEHELEVALIMFYGAVIPLGASNTIQARIKEFAKQATFTMDAETNRFIDEMARKVGTSHVNTVLDDMRNTIKDTVDQIVEETYKEAGTSIRDVSAEDLAKAREDAIHGSNHERVVSKLKQAFSDRISKNRAETVARTETARAFNQAQYEADRQFLTQNNLMLKAYKVWSTHSGNPCAYCTDLADRGPIPFTANFATIGETLSASFTKADGSPSVRMMPITFQNVYAGNLHPNCECDYKLVIMG